MAEHLDIFDLSGRRIDTRDRKEYYKDLKKEWEETGQITTQVKTVRIWAMRENGDHILQKRSRSKKENSGLYDKFIGGHIPANSLSKLTLINESMQEFSVPAFSLSKEEMYATLLDDSNAKMLLEKIALVREVDYENQFKSVRVYKDDQGNIHKMVQPLMNTLYVGYYNGDTRVGQDGETGGIQVMSNEELLEELQIHPDLFTSDVHYIVNKYHKELVSIQYFLQ
ncbi:hypothetical protein FACS189428_0750 [Clostridia bacterium]|nr:hypothetical protein FACS189428_0750 [Clostridia bacterium]